MKPFDLKQFKQAGGQVHFIGCAGAGTQPLASIFLDLGFPCSGSDLVETERTEQLRSRGMSVFRGHRRENLPPEGTPLLVVHTSAAEQENPELLEAHRRAAAVLRRGEALALLGEMFPHTIAVAGSHGKTSVTSQIAHALKQLECNPGYLIGGSVTGWKISGTAGMPKHLICLRLRARMPISVPRFRNGFSVRKHDGKALRIIRMLCAGAH